MKATIFLAAVTAALCVCAGFLMGRTSTEEHVTNSTPEAYTEEHLRAVEENARLFATHMEQRDEIKRLQGQLDSCLARQ